MTNKPDWRSYWEDLDDPGRRHAEDSDAGRYAQELMMNFPASIRNCLELGCGEGSLYTYFQSRVEHYVGIDFSPAMLKRFDGEHPGLHLICADASQIPLSGMSFDFVFSVGLMQYFDEEQLRRNLRQVRELLVEGGTYLITFIPDSQLRLHYYALALKSEPPSILGGLRTALRVFVMRRSDGIGYWFHRHRVARVVQEEGFSCRTFSSNMYEYRFHALLQKQ
jgi:SAM-dependent methyltransferase